MKKKQLTLIVLSIFSIVTLFSHPAKKITLSFDQSTKILQVSIDHAVKNPENHFISEISVTLNGKEIITQSFQKQESAANSTLLYKIFEAKSGDEIEITATCNKFGTVKEKISVS